jgi:hypothetical protein
VTRILLCGEGPEDVGQTNFWDGKSRSLIKTEGWLQVIARKILNVAVTFDSIPRNQLVLLPRDQTRHKPLPAGHGKKALISKVIALRERFDCVIFMADADSSKPNIWKRVRREILDGFDRIPGSVKSVACVPKSASESWLLADETAWIELGLGDARLLPTHPENIWGPRTDPTGNHPHAVFARVCRSAQRQDDRETRLEVAEKTRLLALSKKSDLSKASKGGHQV